MKYCYPLILCLCILTLSCASTENKQVTKISPTSVNSKQEMSWSEKVVGKIKPLIIFDPSEVAGNPVVLIQIDLASNGKILKRTIVKSSGNQEWDKAALKAIDKAKSLPLDGNGRVPVKTIRVAFRPKD